jgi:hypothetical protein
MKITVNGKEIIFNLQNYFPNITKSRLHRYRWSNRPEVYKLEFQFSTEKELNGYEKQVMGEVVLKILKEAMDEKK